MNRAFITYYIPSNVLFCAAELEHGPPWGLSELERVLTADVATYDGVIGVFICVQPLAGYWRILFVSDSPTDGDTADTTPSRPTGSD